MANRGRPVKTKKDTKFASRVKKAMEKVDLRPGQLAGRMGNHAVTVSRWLGGQRPGDRTMERLAGVLRVRLKWLKMGQGKASMDDAGSFTSQDEFGPQGLAAALIQVQAARIALAQVAATLQSTIEVMRLEEGERVLASHRRRRGETAPAKKERAG